MMTVNFWLCRRERTLNSCALLQTRADLSPSLPPEVVRRRRKCGSFLSPEVRTNPVGGRPYRVLSVLSEVGANGPP